MALINIKSLLVFMPSPLLVSTSSLGKSILQLRSEKRQKNQLRNGSNRIIIIKNALVMLTNSSCLLKEAASAEMVSVCVRFEKGQSEGISFLLPSCGIKIFEKLGALKKLKSYWAKKIIWIYRTLYTFQLDVVHYKNNCLVTAVPGNHQHFLRTIHQELL